MREASRLGDSRHQCGSQSLEEERDRGQAAAQEAANAATQGEKAEEQRADGEEEADEYKGKHEAGQVVVVFSPAHSTPSACRQLSPHVGPPLPRLQVGKRPVNHTRGIAGGCSHHRLQNSSAGPTGRPHGLWGRHSARWRHCTRSRRSIA